MYKQYLLKRAFLFAFIFFALIFSLNVSATMIFVGENAQKIFSNKEGGWVYKYRVRVTHDFSGRMSHTLSVRDSDREEIPYASSNRVFFTNGTNPASIDVYIKLSDANKKRVIICAITSSDGPKLGSCTYLPGLQ